MPRSSLTAALALLTLAWVTLFALSLAVDLPTTHLDGAFQTASGLYRLDAGQMPGRDFLPYLGIGPLLAIYPAFKTFGANLHASVAATQMMTLLLSIVCIATLAHLVFRPRFAATSLGVAALIVGGAVGARMLTASPLAHALDYAIDPGNSLRPMRTAAPYLVALAFWGVTKRVASPTNRIVLFGLACGAVLLWSNDFALPTAGLFGFLFLGDLARRGELTPLRFVAFGAASLGVFAVLLTLATALHPLPFLRFNLVDVAGDQWWYFGPYDARSRIFGLADLRLLMSHQTMPPLAILALSGLVALRTRRLELVLVFWIGLTLLAGGVLASVGGHGGRYFGGFALWGALTAGFGAARLASAAWVRLAGGRTFGRARFETLTVAAALILSVALVAATWRQRERRLEAAAGDPKRIVVAELGGWLPVEWRDFIELARTTRALKSAEEYWGLWSATGRSFAPWPVDSVIHALGGTREAAARGLDRTDIVVTTLNATAPDWQSWGLGQNFWLYDELFRGWTPAESSPTTIVWRRRPEGPRPAEPVPCETTADGPSIALPGATRGYYRIEIGYDVAASGRKLLLVESGVSLEDGVVSLDPNRVRASFPVYVREGAPAALPVRVVGRPDARVTLASCEASRIAFDDPRILPPDPSPGGRR